MCACACGRLTVCVVACVCVVCVVDVPDTTIGNFPDHQLFLCPSFSCIYNIVSAHLVLSIISMLLLLLFHRENRHFQRQLICHLSRSKLSLEVEGDNYKVEEYVREWCRSDIDY
jgi:hypothetical protein